MPIQISDPVNQTLIFIALFLIVTLLTIRRSPGFEFLSKDQSNELKGFAILAIIFSHIGYFLVSDHRFMFPLSIAAGVGVDLFLVLSGFGLVASALKTPLNPFQFYKKRLLKIFIPAWIAIILILISEYLLLGITYPANSIIQNLLGFYPVADIYQSLNSPLWYFTFILFYYLLFPWFFIKKLKFASPLIIFALSYFLVGQALPINSDVLGLYRLHLVSFPVGMTLALVANYLPINNRLQRFSSLFVRLPIIILAAFLFGYFAIHSGVGHPNLWYAQGISLLSVFLLIKLFIFKPFKVRLFDLFGRYSYEIYLTHWPILLHFGVLYLVLPGAFATVAYLVAFILLAYGIQKLVSVVSFDRKG